MSKTTDSLSSTCVLCCQGIKIYAVGPCNHHICFKCSTKMRVICNQMYCAVCRTEMLKVIFMNKLHPYEGIISHKFPYDRKYGISFATSRIQEEYRKLLAHNCKACGIKRSPDGSFRQLQDHVRKDHELFFCQLCVDHIKVLTSERKLYTRKELAQHRRLGDPDDTSYKGHPNCEFCDVRYFDKDELMRHLRREHYFCHFCESDGIMNQFYGEYIDLADHFRTDHYMCEEDGCANVEFTNAFRTDIDLKAHKAKIHSGKMTKIQARQTRQVDVEINLPARPTNYNRGRRDGAYGGGARGGRDRYRRDRPDHDKDRAIEASLESAQKEEMEREVKKTKAKPKKPRDSRRVNKSDEERSESPTENLGRDSKKDRREDKENETLTRVSDMGQARPPPPSLPQPPPPPPSQPRHSLPSQPQHPLPSQPKNPIPSTEQRAPTATGKPPGMGDFPTLGDLADAPFQMGGKWNLAPSQKPDDFPALGNGDGGSNVPLNVAASFGFYSSMASNKGTLNNQPAEPTNQQAQATSRGADDFPTLSSIASILGVNQKSILKPRKKIKPTSKERVQSEPSTSSASISKDKPFSSILGDKKEPVKEKKAEKVASKVPEKKQVPPQMQTSKTIGEAKKADKAQIPPQMQSSNNNTLQKSTAPPPGTSRPPPGFTPVMPQKSTLSSTSSVVQPPPGFTKFSPVSSVPDFVPPPNFKERNRDLVMKIQDFCEGKDALFAQFKQDSGEFRQSMITGSEYYQRCMDTLSEENFHQIFNELVSLLPDVVKQQQLLEAHNDYKVAAAQSPKDVVLKISNKKSGKKTAWKATGGSGGKAESSRCPVCSQVVLAQDLANHMNAHEDFPALSAGKPPSRPVAGGNKSWGATSWGRGK